MSMRRGRSNDRFPIVVPASRSLDGAQRNPGKRARRVGFWPCCWPFLTLWRADLDCAALHPASVGCNALWHCTTGRFSVMVQCQSALHPTALVERGFDAAPTAVWLGRLVG